VVSQAFKIIANGQPCSNSQQRVGFQMFDTGSSPSFSIDFTCPDCIQTSQKPSSAAQTNQEKQIPNNGTSGPASRTPAGFANNTQQRMREIKTVQETPFGEHYYVIFAARGNSPTGHAFVMWGQESELGGESTYEGYGYYPANNSATGQSMAVLGPIPAEIVNEAKKTQTRSWPLATDILIVEVDLNTFLNSHLLLQFESKKPPKYFPLLSDCVTFLERVANSIGLPAPARSVGTLLPQAYVRALIENADKPAHLSFSNGSTWDGPVLYGLPNGYGTYHFANNDSYVGNARGGQWNGKGTYTSSNGRFEGYYVNGTPSTGTYSMANGAVVSIEAEGKESWRYSGVRFSGDSSVRTTGSGHGRYDYPDGSSFDGEFRNGVATRGSYRWKNGTTFSGSFEGNNPSVGTLTGPNGAKYTGKIVNGLPQGRGTFSVPNSLTYEGDFKGGIRDGQGKITFQGGSTYEGAVSNGFPNGRGTWFGPGFRYTGDFRDGVKEGRGTMLLTDGSQYEGEFSRGLPNGSGVLTGTGLRYQGQFKDSLREGSGTLTFADGSKYEGPFVGGQPVGSGSFTSASGSQTSATWSGGQLQPSAPVGGTASRTSGPRGDGFVRPDPKGKLLDGRNTDDMHVSIQHFTNEGRPDSPKIEKPGGMTIDVGGKQHQ
jgi:hypothetical protein